MVNPISTHLSLTHTGADKLTKVEISTDLEEIKKRLTREFKNDPKKLAEQFNVRSSYEFLKKDAWDLNRENQFDIITSNGLNIYEKDDDRVVALYKAMYHALKDNGYLICSALTPPPTLTQNCEWNMNQINLAAAATLLKTIIGVTWTNFRSSQQTSEQLHEAGFENIEIFWDKQKMFPTFLAKKPTKIRDN